MFSSDSPTYLLKTSGPLTICRLLALRALASCRAISVLPVPGGPQSRMPFTCLIPNFSITEWGSRREAKARRKRLVSSVSSPPMPSDYIEKSAENTFFFCSLVDRRRNCCSPLAKASMMVSGPMKVRPASAQRTRSTVRMIGILVKLTTKTCSKVTQHPVKSFLNCLISSRSSSSTRSLGGCSSSILRVIEEAGRSAGRCSQGCTSAVSMRESERNSLNFLLRPIFPLGIVSEKAAESTYPLRRMLRLPAGILPSGERQTLLLKVIYSLVTATGVSSSVIVSDILILVNFLLSQEPGYANNPTKSSLLQRGITSCGISQQCLQLVSVMSRINYSRNMARTDCNYSFCEEKENFNPNSPMQDLTRILNRHYQLHLKNAHTIREQATQINRMQAAILSIEGKLSLGSRPQKSISSISKRETHYQHSTDSFPSHSHPSHPSASASSKQSSAKTASINKKSKAISVSGHSGSSSENSPKNNSKLLSSIVQRKLMIEKELKERLRKHLQPGKNVYQGSVSYITYASEG